MIKVNWADFKNYITQTSANIQYIIDSANNYNIYFSNGKFEVYCIIDISDPANANQIDFETNYKNLANQSAIDVDGIPFVRIKASKKGWTYAAIPIEFKTSQLNSLYAKTFDNQDRAGISLKFYNAQDVEITDQANELDIVKTVIEFEPLYDYEIIGGTIRINQTFEDNCRLWIIAVPDIPANQGGSKEMAGGFNLKYLTVKDEFSVDGRVAKTMLYNAIYHTNKLKFIFKHVGGLKIDMQTVIELYRL